MTAPSTEKSDRTDAKAAEEGRVWAEFERALATEDDGQAAQSHLAAGRPIHYRDDRYPEAIVREWPDGRRELVHRDAAGHVTTVRRL